MRSFTALLHSWLNSLAHVLAAVSFALVLAAIAAAQSPTDGSTPSGFAPGSPAGSYALSDFDTVNLYNGGLNIRLPIFKIGGRGQAGYPITLHVEKKWTVHKHIEPGVGTFYYADAGWWSEEASGWRIFAAGKVDIRSAWREQPTGFPVETLTRITFSAPDGTEYELRDQATNGQPVAPQTGGFNRGRVFVTSDGTAATFYSDWDIIDDPNFGQGFYDDQPDGYMLLKDGTRFRVDDGKITWMRDRNGNKVSFAYDIYRRVTSATDSLGRQVTITYPSGGVTYTEIAFKGFGGTQRTIRIGQTNLWSTGTLRSDFSAQTIGQLFPGLSGGGPADSTVINYVELPDGRRYQFQYNSYAEVARVVLPTGGAIEYDYAAGLTDGAASGVFSIGNDKYIYRRVIERRIYPDGGSGSAYASKMTYSRPETNTANAGYVVTEQCTSSGSLGVCGTGTARLDHSRHYFYGSPRASFAQTPTQYASWQEGKEYKTEFYDTNGTTLLQVVENTWQQPLAGATWPLGQTETNTSVKPNSPQITQTQTTLSDTGQVSKQTFAYDRYANRTDVYEYDYGAATPFRRTHTDYVTTNTVGGTTYDYACSPSTTCSNASINKDVIHQRSLPKQVSIYDAAGVEQLRTAYEYDNYTTDTNHAPLVDRFSITGLCTTYDAAGTCSNTNPPIYITRGNVTSTTKYLLTDGTITGSVSTYQQCDVAGNAVKSIDARGKTSTLDYADSFCNGSTCGGTYNSYTYAFATSAASPVPDPTGQYGSTTALTTSTVYDFWSGLAYSTTDVNNKTTTLSYADALGNLDPLDRLKSVTRPDGSKIDFNYGDTVGNLYVQTLADLDASRRTDSRQYFDGFGRGIRSFTWENQDAAKPWLTIDTQYDALGRAWRVSKQYRSAGPGSIVNPSGWVETTFDALGRKTQVKTTADGAYATTSYIGNATTVTDQHDASSPGHSRKIITDAIGRLTEVYEDPSGLNYLNSYQYDVLDKLHTVTQGTQTRTFVYDSLGRLTSATNPESGTVSYSYDNNGNVLTKTDARGVVITYAYDALNRNTTTDYSDTASINPDIKRIYDGATNGKGRFYYFFKGGDYTTGSNVEQSAVDSYDALGRPLVKRQLFKINGMWSQSYQMQRSYDRAGNVLTETYASGHTVSYNYDAAGRPGDNGAAKAFSGNLGDGVTRTYDSEIRYHEMGGMEQERFGTDTAVYNKGLYNSRGQLAEIRVSTYSILSPGQETNWNRGAIINHYSHASGAWGATGGGPDNNGNLQKQEIYIPDNDQITGYTNVVQEYNYDSLNRLTSVYDKPFNGTPDFIQGYVYDRWGNRTIDQTLTTSNAPKPQFTSSSASNRLAPPSGYTMTYDVAGNLTYDNYQGGTGGGGTRTYDAENRMTSAQFISGQLQTATFAYDADGHRTRRSVGAGGEVWQVYGIGDELLAEYAANASPSSPQKEYGYRSGELLVTADGSTAPAAGNTGFESPNVGGGGYQYNPAGGTWTFAGGTGVSGNGSAFTYGNPAAPEGAQVGFIQGGNTSVISQSVSGFQSGTRYTVTFKAAQRGNAGQPGQDFDVYLDTTLLGTFVPPSTSYTQASTASFTTTAGAHTLKFVGRNTNGGDNTAFIDGVSVVAGVKITTSSVTASGSWNGNVPAYAADGSTSTTWVSGGFPQQWVQLDLGSAYTLSSVRLDVNQNPAGATTHQVWGGPSPDQMSLLGTLSGNTQNGQWIELATAAANVRYLKVLTTSGPSWVAWTEIEVYADSASVGGGVNWLVADQLGTPRMVLDKTGSLSGVTRHDYLPFGEMVPADPNYRTTTRGYVGDDVRQKFTAHERDDETGLDYAEARYYSSALGRFTSPDEVTKDSKVGDPQSWNKYAYVRNNPLQLTDPTGEKAGVVVETAPDGTRTITITGTIAIWADKNSGISQEELNKAAQMMQDQINNGWSGTYEENGVKYNVKTEMKVEVVQGDPSASKADNVIQMTNGTFNFQGKVAHGAIEPRAYFGGPDTGRINIRDVLSGNNVAKHEFGHMLGVGDRYEDEHHDALMFGIYGMPAQAATSKDFGWALSGVIGEHDDKLAEYRYFGPAPGVTARSIVGHKPGKTSSTLRAPYVFWN